MVQVTFTDDDLKRLKFKMENAVNAEQSTLVTDPDSVLALLARLEAAEDFREEVFKGKEFWRCATIAMRRADDKWRKAAGK